MTKSLDLPVSAGTNETLVGVTATATSSATVLACSVCCVLPLALPAAAFAGAGATMTWFENASPWMTVLSVVIVSLAWVIIWRQSVRTERRAARSTIILLSISTFLTVIALLWVPFIEGVLIRLLS